jgi:hypothetical protein
VHPHAVLFKGRNRFETIVAFDGVTFFPVVFFPLNKIIKNVLVIWFQFDCFLKYVSVYLLQISSNIVICYTLNVLNKKQF